MTSKILIGSGVLLILFSLIGIVAGIFLSFQALKTNESAGIGAVGSGIQFALISNIVFFVGLLILIVGLVKFYRDRKSRS